MILARLQRRAGPDRTAAFSVLAGMTVLSAAAWAITVWQSRAGDALMMAGVPMAPGTAGRPGGGSAALFLLIWLAMMVAMMFPSVWPVVLLYRTIVRSRGGGSIPFFLLGYLLAWEAAGAVVYAGYLVAGQVLAARADLAARLPALTGMAIVCTGLYQLTPLKRACLAHCQGPLGYVITRWREGRTGALRMGVGHGGYCLGCCAGVMGVLAVLGVMDLRWMAVAAAVIAAEKLGPRHRALPLAIGAGLVLVGIAVAVWSPAGRMPAG